MNTALTSSAPAVHDLHVDHLFTLHLELTKRVLQPGGPEGASVRVGVIDGTFVGERLSGRIVPLVGYSHSVLRGEGYARTSFELTLTTDDRSVLAVTGNGIVHLSDARRSRLALTFHTFDEPLLWLNHVQAVGNGVTRGRDEATFDVYQLL